MLDVSLRLPNTQKLALIAKLCVNLISSNGAEKAVEATANKLFKNPYEMLRLHVVS